MAKQMRVGVKAAWITTSGVVLTTILILLFSKSKNSSKESTIQKVKEQKVDSGSLNNYNAGRDIKIENNTYNKIVSDDSLIKKSNSKNNVHEQTNVTSVNQKGGQTAKEIINNNQ